MVAYTDKNRYIGCDNDIPWKRSLQGDLRFMNLFIRLRPNSALIMGRRTFESMPRKKNITQIVLTSDPGYKADGAVVVSCFEEAVKYCKDNELYMIVFGGSRVYEMALKYKCRIFYTLVEEGDLKGDTTYPGHVELSVPTNITDKVEQLLLDGGVKRTWECDGEKFTENGYVYRFFLVEN